MSKEDRLSFSNRPDDAASFDNFGQLVAALRLQFLQGIPPTPENINRATSRAENVAREQLSNPDSGAASPVAQPSTQLSGVGGVPSIPDGAPSTAPIAPQRPPVNTQPQARGDSKIKSRPIGEPGDVDGLSNEFITKLIATVLAGGAAVSQARRNTNFPNTGPAATPNINPSVDPLRIGEIPIQTIQIPEQGKIAGPDTSFAMPPPAKQITGPDNTQTDIGGDLTGNEGITTGADRGNAIGGDPNIEARARAAAEAVDTVNPPSLEDVINVLPTKADGTPDVTLLQTVMNSLRRDGVINTKNFTALPPKSKIAIMQAVMAGLAAQRDANTRGGLIQGAGLHQNRLGTITIDPPSRNNALRKAFGAIR